MKHPHRDWEYEFRDEFPGATDEQVRQAWEREQSGTRPAPFPLDRRTPGWPGMTATSSLTMSRRPTP